MRAAFLLAAFLFSQAIAGATWAQSGFDRKGDGLQLALTAGFFDAVQLEDETEEVRVEYRYDLDWYLKPMGGLMLTADQAAHVFMGVYAEYFFTDNFYVSPSFAPGIFMKGQGKDLGHVVQFRSQLDLGWRFDNALRLSVSLNHISNAGLGKFNPGSETVAVTLSFPLHGYFD